MNSEEILEIQGKLYDLIKYFDDFCKSNDVAYYLACGNAIGAMRHQGFIPWDDDFDVYMTQDNYAKFLRVAEEKLDTKQFYLQKENTKEWPLFFSKLRMNGTTYWEEDTKDRKMHKGFYIDVFCLYDMPSSKAGQYIKYFSGRVLQVRSIADKGYKNAGLLVKVLMFFSKIFVPNFVKNSLSKIINRRVKSVKYVAGLFVYGRFSSLNRICFPISWIGTPRLVKYGSLELPVFEKVESYLTHTYGDYMSMPSKEVRSQYQSHAIFFDTRKDYKWYDEK